MNCRCLVLVIAGAATCSVQAPSAAPSAGTGMTGAISMMSPQEFVTKAGMDGMTEAQLGQLAARQAQSNDVKQFAQQMITEHRNTNVEVTALVQRKALQAPTDIESDHQSMVQMLSANSRGVFDTAYANELLSSHYKAIALFTRASNVCRHCGIRKENPSHFADAQTAGA